MGERAFAAINAALIVALAVLLGEARLLSATTRVAALWPYALGVAALGTLLVSRALAVQQKRHFLARHHLLFALVGVGFVLAAADPATALRRWAIAYALLVFAFAAHALVGLWSAAPLLTDGRVARLVAGTVLVAQLIAVPYLAIRIFPEADEPHYLITAASIAHDRDLDLTNDYLPERYRTFYPGRLPDRHAIQVGPRLYPIRELGLPLVAALPFGLAGRPGVLMLLAGVAALLAAQLYLLLRDLCFARQVALAATGLAAMAHPLVTYATQIYPDMLVALAAVTAIRLARRGPLTRPLDAAFAAGCVAVVPWLTTRADFYAAGLGLCLVAFAVLAVTRADIGARARTAGSFALAFAPAAGVFAALLVTNWFLFGLPIPGAGFYLISDQHIFLSGAPHAGTAGLLFDRVFGLVPRAPFYLLAFLGVAGLAARARSATPMVLMLGLGGLLHFAFVASLEYWHSDWSPPSRNLVAILPLLVAAVAAGLETLTRATRRWRIALLTATGAAVLWSLVVAVLYMGIPAIRYNLPATLRATGETGKFWLLIQQTLGGLDIGRALPSVVQQSSSALPLALAWAALALALVALGWHLRRRAASV